MPLALFYLLLSTIGSNTSATQPSIQIVEANVSAYCPCSKCCEKWANVFPRRTASGHILKKGDKFVAMPRSYPFGTLVSIPNYNNGNWVKVLDRGGAIKGNKIDVYFDTHQEALKWGRQHLKVKIMLPKK